MLSQQGSPQRSLSPDPQPSASGRKRKRKTFSCYDCRRRKLRCDRIYPSCGRCQKSGNAASCVYDARRHYSGEDVSPSVPGPLAEELANKPSEIVTLRETNGFPANHRVVPKDTVSLIQQQADRIAVLEDRLARLDPTQATTDDQSRNGAGKPPGWLEAHSHRVSSNEFRTLDTVAVGHEEAFVFRGNGFKTQFYGPSSPMSAIFNSAIIIKSYPEFKTFVTDPTMRSQTLLRLRTDAENIRKRVRMEKKLSPRAPVVTLFALLPDKDTVTEALQVYWEVMENTYRILHRPSFLAMYQTFWLDPSQGNEPFVAIMLLMMAIVSCMDRRHQMTFKGLSSTGREQATVWVEACEDWLARESRKHLTLESFQIRVLLHLAKQVNCIKSKQLWEGATALLNFGFATGLHQDPTKLDKMFARENHAAGPYKERTSAYEREMRRRLWATMVEIELQVSFDRGLLSSRTVLTTDCGVPSLLPDDDFDETTAQLPAPEPLENYIPTSYLHISQKSLPLRVALNNLINDTSAEITYEQLLSLDERITQALESFPEWVNTAQNAQEPSSTMVPAALLDIQLRQFQLCLHVPFARQGGSNPRSKYSRMICINTASRILELHGRLAMHGYHGLNMLRDDVFRAAMAICHNTVLWGALQSDIFVQSLSRFYSDQVENGLALLEEKILRLGEHYGQLWFLSAGYGMLRSGFTRNEIDVHVQGMVERLTTLFHKVLSQQEESNEHTAAGALTALAAPNGNSVQAPPMVMSDINSLPLESFSLDSVNLPGWNFNEPWPFTGTGLSW